MVLTQKKEREREINRLSALQRSIKQVLHIGAQGMEIVL